jgi:hypothetical protein
MSAKLKMSEMPMAKGKDDYILADGLRALLMLSPSEPEEFRSSVVSNG